MSAENTEDTTGASTLNEISINIFLASGRNVAVSVSPTQTVTELRKMAQQAFGKGFLQLLSKGSILSPNLSVATAGLKEGDTLMAIFQTANLVATQEAFALWARGGPVVTWGDPGAGGAGDQLTSVQQVVQAHYAFAAILTDGHVVAWGDIESGGLCFDVQDELTSVKQLVATDAAFAALRANGSLVTFGDENSGALRRDSPLHSELLEMRSVVKLAASCAAFAAILVNGRVFTWGKDEFGGNSREVQSQLWNVTDVIGKRNNSSFTALADRQVVATWGSSRCCASKEVQERLKHVKSIDCTSLAWAAILEDGDVVTWGYPCSGGVVPKDVQDRLHNVSKILGTDAAFAALLANGSVVSWGDPEFGGNDEDVRDQLTDVVQLHAGYNMFLAVRKDGRIVRWGGSNAMSNWEHHGGHLEVEPHLKDLQDFCSTDRSFAALLTDGQVFAWGHPDTGGSNRRLQHEIWKT